MGLKFSSFTLSLQDVSGKLSLVVFLQGCNFRCRHCHNWKLVMGKEKREIPEQSILAEVVNNPVLEALVISGGEPILYEPDRLKSFILKVKDMKPNLSIRIDTNGSNPEALSLLKNSVDGFAIDLKAPIDERDTYSYTAGVKINVDDIKRSLLIADGMPLTIFRTTKYPWLSNEQIEKIRKFTSSLSSPWFLNEFVAIPECPFN